MPAQTLEIAQCNDFVTCSNQLASPTDFRASANKREFLSKITAFECVPFSEGFRHKRVFEAALKGFVLPLFYGAKGKMLEKRNSADGGGGDTDRDMAVASATAAAPAKEAFSPQDSALNSPRDGFADEKTERIPDGDIGTTSPSSSSDCGSQRVGDEKGRDGVWVFAVKVLTWTPKKLRYDPNNPPQFSLAHNFLYAVVSV